MNVSIRHLLSIFFFLGAIATPTFAFDSTLTSDEPHSTTDSTCERAAMRYTSELQIIAAQVRGWNASDRVTKSGEDRSDSDLTQKLSEESDALAGIKKLDSVFSDYVMAKYIQRIRHS